MQREIRPPRQPWRDTVTEPAITLSRPPRLDLGRTRGRSKHVAERFHQARATGHSYFGKGMFIVAARARGLRVWRSYERTRFVSFSERAAGPR